MQINVPSYRHGLRLLSLTVEVEGEATGVMLAKAVESVKTDVSGALDGVARAELPKEKRAGFERKSLSEADIMRLAAKVKLPTGYSNVKVADVGAWTGVQKVSAEEIQRQINDGIAAGVAAALAAMQSGVQTTPMED